MKSNAFHLDLMTEQLGRTIQYEDNKNLAIIGAMVGSIQALVAIGW